MRQVGTLKKRSAAHPVIARIGGEWSYSGLATRDMFGSSAHVTPFSTFDECLQKVHDAKADIAVVPVRNPANKLICGSDKVTPVIEIANRLGLKNVYTLPFTVDHVLASYGDLGEITNVYSKSEPLVQCSRFIKRHGMLPLSHLPDSSVVSDTESALKHVHQYKISYMAAICSREAADHYGVPVVCDGIADAKVNQTEFYVYARHDDMRNFAAHIRT